MGQAHGLGRRAAIGFGLATLAGCQSTPPTGANALAAARLDNDGTGYLFIQAPITPTTRTLFETDVDRLADLGAKRIYLLINSPGGSIPATRAMMGHMDQVKATRGIPFTTHNVGVVASAACYLYLNGQARACSPGSTFLFHAATMVGAGAFTTESLETAAARLRDFESFFRRTLKARTRLTDAEIESFLHRTVILSAEEARRDGISDTTQAFTSLNGAVALAIRTGPPPGRAPSSSPGGTSQPVAGG